MIHSLKLICTKIKTQFTDAVLSMKHSDTEGVFHLKPQFIVTILSYIKDEQDMEFKQLIDICGVDYPEREKRFDVVYHLLSYRYNYRLRFKIAISEEEKVLSINKIYSCANWYEREAWDMFGIKFAGNENQDRILTDYNFSGHPLRKDFPLVGHIEPHYDNQQQKIVYDSVELPQEYRNFDFLSPWEGDYDQPKINTLPGDEKTSIKNNE